MSIWLVLRIRQGHLKEEYNVSTKETNLKFIVFEEENRWKILRKNKKYMTAC